VLKAIGFLIILKMKKKYSWFIFLPLLFFFFVFLQKVSAQESTGIALSPPTFEISANPGDILKNTIRVENLNDRAIQVVVDKRNFTALGEEGSVSLTEEETPFSLASWISVEPTEAEIGAKSTRTFVFTTNVPLNAEPGGHFGSIVFKVGADAKVAQTGATVSQELGALVLLEIAGKATEAAILETFNAKKLFWEKGPVDFEIRVKNEGNVHLKPQGTIMIMDTLGKRVAHFEIEPKNVLPGAIRRTEASWEKGFILGRYTATASLVYGTKGEILTGSTTFIGFPYRLAGIIGLILVVVILFLYKIRKRLKLALRVLFGKYK